MSEPTSGPRSTERITVWAPQAGQVEVDLGADRHPMHRAEDGWWAFEAPSGDEPLDYAFCLDGGNPLPDPRTAWQPQGVHGPSRRFDAAAHQWQDAAWRGPREGAGVPGGVIYELHVGTFTPEGTLEAAEGHLEHLVALGVDVVEVMPVAAFGGTHGWGYDGVAPYAVQHSYGGPAAFQRFVDACHARGLGVCLDVVYNHLGPTGNYLSSFGPYFTDRHTTPWGPALNFDAPGSPQVRRWVIDNALRWFREFHVDALRLDAVHELRDDSTPHILEQLSQEVAALAAELGRPLDLVAECDLNDPVMVTPVAAGGRGMTAQWDDDIHHALHVALTGETSGYYADFAGHNEALPEGGALAVLAKTLTSVFLHDGRYSTFRRSRWGAPVDPTTTSGHRFLAYLQTHDQVGNRATGDRIGHTITAGQQAVGAALYLLSPYTAMIFMGEEWRASSPFQFFTSFEEEELAQAVREGRRGEFAAHGWAEQDVPDPQDPATRDASVLRWAEVCDPEHARTLDFYRRLVELRRSEPDLATGDLETVCVDVDEEARWLVLRRGALRVVANFADAPATVPLDAPVGEVLASWSGRPDAKGAAVSLAGHDVAVVRTA